MINTIVQAIAFTLLIIPFSLDKYIYMTEGFIQHYMHKLKIFSLFCIIGLDTVILYQDVKQYGWQSANALLCYLFIGFLLVYLGTALYEYMRHLKDYRK